MQTEAIIDIMVAEAIKTSEIEGEYLSRKDVASSIRNHLGLAQPPGSIKDRMAQGAGELMADARNTYAEALTEEKLFGWHRMLLKENRGINIGMWRSHGEPMQVVSGALGKEKVHFEAPPSSRVPAEMGRFIQWFNDTAPGGAREMKKAPVRSAIAHLYFESIHPFEDGNGRIGRAIAEKALSQTLGRPVLLSLSRTIEADKRSYYQALEKAQRGNEITPWVNYFVGIALKAQGQAIELVDFILKKSKFFDRFKGLLNEREVKAVNRMLEAGPEGFEGGMSARKYMSITKASKATATRDLQHLLELEALILEGGGRSTRYILNI
ncbi:Fic family protein [Rufibacter quisquiliarum]|uniref:Fic family protein n=2 Tax=Rufibacter quisquiliarum TaxID=1549639 RepID=A0A839GAK4_9BACT|nr:Fic family protein [Rufibacter quisquiliarum]